MYNYQTKIKLHETDAAGLLFFANQFKIIHDAYEGLLEELGFGFPDLLKDHDFFLPIVHAESDFKKPTHGGDRITVQTSLQELGRTSFTLRHEILNEQGETAAIVTTVHVAVNDFPAPMFHGSGSATLLRSISPDQEYEIAAGAVLARHKIAASKHRITRIGFSRNIGQLPQPLLQRLNGKTGATISSVITPPSRGNGFSGGERDSGNP